MENKPFWRGVAQQTLSRIVTELLVAVAVSVYGRSRLIHQSVSSTIYTFVYVIGICLVALAVIRASFWMNAKFPLRQIPIPTEAPRTETLRDKVLQLGRDLFAFVREKGPDPKPPTPESGATLDDHMRWLVEVKSPFSESILHGYKLRFEERVRDVYHEFGEKGIAHKGIGELGGSGHVNSIEQVKAKAHACFNIVKEMDIAEEEKTP